MQFEFEAQLWLWDERQGDSWTFVSLPDEVSAEIRDFSRLVKRAGFGSVPVSVEVGSSRWDTSVFPDAKSGVYVLPIKKAIRTSEAIGAGDVTFVRLAVRSD